MTSLVEWWCWKELAFQLKGVLSMENSLINTLAEINAVVKTMIMRIERDFIL